uniref:Putative Leucine-rich repeat protein kinase family protein n=1 Tax=Davidia involucrata TaxID=16924 RepID=A0A5B7CAI7_DAVIN
MQEKLLVYEYQPNGSLFSLLLGTQMGHQAFDWSSRLNIAATIAEALAFMHQELREDGIAHGNLKSSNIVLNNNMVPCISEYGLMVPSLAKKMVGQSKNSFKSDIYGFGVILLELLTGKVSQNNGLDLARWALSVVREEWTVEVFDKTLIQEGANEDRMMNLLQVAIKCVNPSSEASLSINQVALMINTMKEEEERSIISEA